MTTKAITWDYNGLSNNANFFGTQKDWNSTIMVKLNRLCGEYIQTHKHRPNFIGSGPDMISIIEDLSSFYYTLPDIVFDNTSKQDMIPIGTLKNRYSVWESMNMAGKPYIYMGFIAKEDIGKINEMGLQKYAVVNNFPALEVVGLNFFR